MKETTSNKARLKKLRQAFNAAVFGRARGFCEGADCAGKKTVAVDAHHITDRHEMPNHGYAKENGIALCAACHEKAELPHRTNGAEYVAGYQAEELYARIASSLEEAIAASKKLA